MTDRVVTQLNAALTDRYEVIREIGAGGMATVFLARDVRHQRNVALKLLNPELGAVLGADRFLAEIQVTANLQHPNLLPLFDSGEAEGLLFYVMPFVDGESLRGKLDREKQLPVDEALRLAIAVSGALAYAHRHGVIHRDLKPENILLSEGQPLVADFGIALAVSKAGGARITQTGLSLGTPQYMSPEQATGDRAIDGRTDIYSLAAVLYEMLTGDPPHTASTSQGVIAKVLTDRPRGVRTTRPAVPEFVEAAIERALEKLPADRWGTASEFADALSGRSNAALSVGSRRVGTLRSRRRDPVVLVSLGLAIVGLGAAGALWKEARNREDPPIVRFSLVTPPDAPPTDAIMPSPDGRLLVYLAATSHGGQLYARPLSQSIARPIAGTEGATSSAIFSPDGKWIAFVAGGKLEKIPIEGGNAIALADVVGGTGMSWSADNVIVLGSEPTVHGLQRVSSDGGQLTLFAKPDSAIGANLCLFPMVLSDGKTVVFTISTGGSVDEFRLAITTLDDGKIEPLGVTALGALGVFDGRLFYVTINGALMAAPFDLRHRRVSGQAVPVLDGVSVCEGCLGAAIGRSGTIVYGQGGTPTRLSWRAGRDTSVDVAQETRSYLEPRLSPDARSIAFASAWGSSIKNDISILDISTGTVRRLTGEGGNHSPEWTRDGKRVIYASNRGGTSSLWWQSADGATPPERLTDSSQGYKAVAVSPNGRTALIERFDGKYLVLDTMSLAGQRTPGPFLHLGANASSARFSPDGLWFAHNSNLSGRPEVYVRSFANPGAVIPISTDGGSEAVWSRDGQHLFYRRIDAKIIDVSVTTTPTFAVLSRRVLYDDKFASGGGVAGYDVSADGKRLLVVRSVDHPEITVVTNWLSEVRRRLRAQP